jgi:hypothetical protein
MQENNSLKYYVFSFSNLLAAFGGGTVLGKCVGIIDNDYLQGDSVLAFFVGTVLGLAFLQFLPKKLSQNAGQWFSACGGIASLILFVIFEKFSVNGKIADNIGAIFFIILSLRFGFWFYSRVLRASDAAGYQRRIAWVELGYYLGIILGLIIWKFINFQIEIASILLLDATVQFVSGIFDYLCATNKILKNDSSDRPVNNVMQIKNSSKILCWRLAIAVMLLTVGIQVITFDLAHLADQEFGTVILAVFYSGVAVAALIYKKLKITLDWKQSRLQFGYANIFIDKIKINFLIINILIALLISSAVVISFYYSISLSMIMLLCIFSAAFLYEIIALAILDRIGFEEKSINHSGMIIRAYGMMGIGAALSLWILNLISCTTLNMTGLIVISLFLSVIILMKRRELIA